MGNGEGGKGGGGSNLEGEMKVRRTGGCLPFCYSSEQISGKIYIYSYLIKGPPPSSADWTPPPPLATFSEDSSFLEYNGAHYFLLSHR